MLIQKLRGKTNVLTKGEFSRSSLAWGEKGVVLPNEPRLYDIGESRKGIMVEEGTTNLLGYRSDISRWTGYQDSAPIVTSNQPDVYGSRHAYRVQGTAATGTGPLVLYTTLGPSAADKVYSWGIWVKTLSKPVVLNTSLGGMLGSLPAWTDWTYISRENYPGNGTTHVQIQIRATEPGGEVDLFVCFPQIEEKAYLTSFIENVREREILTIPNNGVIDPEEGTIQLWWEPHDRFDYSTGTQHRRIVVVGDIPSGNYIALSQWSSAEGLRFYVGTAGAVRFTFSEIGGTNVYGTRNFIQAKWSKSQNIVQLRFNDQIKQTTYPETVPDLGNSTIRIGHNSSQQCNAILGDIRFSSIARPDAELQETYEAGGQLPVDEYTTYMLDFSDDVIVKRRKSLAL